ncbi:hypothetical protein HC761_02060 [bacterium]|nr:hypothetical protein [bacterium]
MSNILKTQFNGQEMAIIVHDNQHWLTARDIALALGYANSDKVNQIVRRHADEFDGLTSPFKLKAQGQSRNIQVFNRKAANLIAILSNTELGKRFRRWIVDHMTTPERGEVRTQALTVQDHDYLVQCQRDLVTMQRRVIRLQASLIRIRGQELRRSGLSPGRPAVKVAGQMELPI